MRGRKPVPNELKRLRGTWRADRHGPKLPPPVVVEQELTPNERDILEFIAAGGEVAGFLPDAKLAQQILDENPLPDDAA